MEGGKLTGSGPQCDPLLRHTPPATCPPVGSAWGRSAWTRACPGTWANPGTGTAAPSGTHPEAAEEQNSHTGYSWGTITWRRTGGQTGLTSARALMLHHLGHKFYQITLTHRSVNTGWWSVVIRIYWTYLYVHRTENTRTWNCQQNLKLRTQQDLYQILPTIPSTCGAWHTSLCERTKSHSTSIRQVCGCNWGAWTYYWPTCVCVFLLNKCRKRRRRQADKFYK